LKKWAPKFGGLVFFSWLNSITTDDLGLKELGRLSGVARLNVIEDGKLGVLASGGDGGIQAGLILERTPARLDQGVVLAGVCS
jgi:hypothetical protein